MISLLLGQEDANNINIPHCSEFKGISIWKFAPNLLVVVFLY